MYIYIMEMHQPDINVNKKQLRDVFISRPH